MPTLVLDLESSSMCCNLHWSSGFSANEEYQNISLNAYVTLSFIGGEKSIIIWLKWLIFIAFSRQLMVSLLSALTAVASIDSCY